MYLSVCLLASSQQRHRIHRTHSSFNLGARSTGELPTVTPPPTAVGDLPKDEGQTRLQRMTMHCLVYNMTIYCLCLLLGRQCSASSNLSGVLQLLGFKTQNSDLADSSETESTLAGLAEFTPACRLRKTIRIATSEGDTPEMREA